jgi:hypothetical protein
MKKAQRHYEPWSLQEAREFVNHYLDGVKYRDVKIVLSQYAEKVGRTYDAISFRQKEILSILTNAERGLGQDKWTKEFQQVIQEILEEGKYSKTKLIMLFE